ncbi:MAG: hypothetical protein E5Y55_20910 [Mesorhizobium sp.]|uniref:hypothetical protein n=1 Tax=Mesorhizobium sp. TaxID=1871066 RepID=UPI0012067BD1|nr:hypothetical protein [Mesorhizobium sp.]TIM42880.1 MAG: hypothetical protein E5Y55_20910 [Mesorhizobium sp.]
MDEILYHSKTSAERQAKWRKRQKLEGLVQAHGWVHAHQLPALLQLIEMLKLAPGLEVGSPRNTMSGRLHKLR